MPASALRAASPRTPLPAAETARGEQSRVALLRAAADVFGERGLDGATTREIAQRAEQNIAAIAYYFGGKDGLYEAVVDHIVEIILQRLGPLLDEIDAFVRRPAPPPATALAHLGALLAAAVGTNREMLAVTNIIVREQTHPTRAFGRLYEGCLARLQTAGAGLVACYVEGSLEAAARRAPEYVVRFHAILGQSLAFRFARETALRGTRWEGIGDREEALIRSVVTEHAALILEGLREKRRRERAGPKKPRGRPAPA